MKISTDELMQGWAAYEFAEADLGDARRTQRLIDLAETLGQRPTASLPEACGDAATLTAAYRFFDNDDIPAEAILTSHVQATDTRLREQPLVLAVQDTVYLDWTHHPATEGLGPLAQAHRQGLRQPQHRCHHARPGAAGHPAAAGVGAGCRDLRAG
jgi:hypothetical protein